MKPAKGSPYSKSENEAKEKLLKAAKAQVKDALCMVLSATSAIVTAAKFLVYASSVRDAPVVVAYVTDDVGEPVDPKQRAN